MSVPPPPPYGPVPIDQQPVPWQPTELPPEPSHAGRPRHRKTFLAAVLLAAVVVAVGVVVAVRGWDATGGPDGAVRGYLGALADGDAESALAYGTIPAGPRTLLTSRVLDEQARIAPIESVSTSVVSQGNGRASVRARYTLAFAAGRRQVDAKFGVHESNGDWRLDRVAVATELLLSEASQRATLLGGPLPSGTVLIFPGAVPITFDTSYLRLSADSGVVAPDSGTTSVVDVEPSAAGTAAVLAAARTALAACLGAHADPRCPLPSERAVPGSLSGNLTGNLAKEVDVSVSTSPSGDFDITGNIDVRGGYQQLEFDNRLTTKSKVDYKLPVDLNAYPVAPLTLRWQRP